MKVILAKTAGFCFGVRRAVNLAESVGECGKECFTLGPIIHNRHVVAHLTEKGVRPAESLEEIPKEATVIIRSHGISKKLRQTLDGMGFNLVDATCPDVSKIHRIVEKESSEGRIPLIIGERTHPEIEGIAGWCDNAVVFENAEELGQWISAEDENRQKAISVVFQTTGTNKNYDECVNLLKKECTNYKVFDTICNATSKRQNEAAELSKQCDVMIVIGGRHSANSLSLYEICKKHCPKVFFIESADEIDRSFVGGADTVGITAGASTPAWIIKEVCEKMSDEILAPGATEKPLEETPAEVVSEMEPLMGETESPEEDSFEALLEKSIKTLNTGDRVTGVVAAITPTEITVDLGTKQSGYIPLSELSDEPDVKIEDIVEIGKEIETYVMRVNDVEGMVMLSKKRLDVVKSWANIDLAYENKTVLEGFVTDENKGGVFVSIKGVKVFVPASQTGVPRNEPLSKLLKQKVRLRITEVNHSRRRVVGSIRSVIIEDKRNQMESFWQEIEQGKRYSGVVKSLTPYGVFVDIGGIDGMVHISELSWSRIKHPSEAVSVGDKLEVYVISFDKEKKKISLGLKDRGHNPWEAFLDAYQVGSTASVRIVKLMPFGAFAEIVPGVDGLIHISQIAGNRIGTPGEVLSEGQVVEAKITDIDLEKKKVSLSIRALLSSETHAMDTENENASGVVYDTDAPPSPETL